MKRLIFALVVFLATVLSAMPMIFAEEFTSSTSYPTKLVYDEATKTMTITYAGNGGWYEFMPISDADDQGVRNYDVQNFIDKYRTEVEHIEMGKFGKIQLVEVKDKNGEVIDCARLFYGMTALKSVHFAVEQRILVAGEKYGLFEGCTNLTTVWFGSDSNKIEGCANFAGCNTKDNDNAKGLNRFSKNLFKGCSSLKNIIYTANINESVLYSSTFEGCGSLESVKIGDNIKNVSKDVFEKYKFIDMETGAEITEALPDPDEGGASTGGDSSGGSTSGGTTGTVTPPPAEFMPEGATMSGHLTGEYNKTLIIDTYWAYYDDTKTLEFTSLTTKYNETGAMNNCDESDWSAYKDVIEHVIVGDNIVKVSGKAFMGYSALKDVRLGKQVAQIDTNAFENCPNLTTIWRDGVDRIEGRADFRGMTRFMDCMKGTSIKEVIMPEKPNTLEINMPMSVVDVYSASITEELKAHAETYLYNLINLNDPGEKYEYYVYIDPNLPLCGDRAVFGFDEATGTLTVYGAGAISDIVNYHGGGSKTQPWFSIRNQVKHVVITEYITSIGKYAFAGFKNLETVQLPNVESFVIGNAAFESCENMKSVYLAGSEPVEGTIDVRNVHTLESWTFAYNFLIANVVVSPKVEKIGNSVFSDNTNLENIYGTPGSFAERYAETNKYNFFDIASSVPQPIKCQPPETSGEETTSATPETSAVPESTAETEAAGTSSPESDEVGGVKFVRSDSLTQPKEESNIMPIIIVASAVAALAVIAVIIVIATKKKAKK